jgi:uncharacterized membrane protein YraQ (UPF0718 family)
MQPDWDVLVLWLVAAVVLAGLIGWVLERHEREQARRRWLDSLWRRQAGRDEEGP